MGCNPKPLKIPWNIWNLASLLGVPGAAEGAISDKQHQRSRARHRTDAQVSDRECGHGPSRVESPDQHGGVAPKECCQCRSDNPGYPKVVY